MSWNGRTSTRLAVFLLALGLSLGAGEGFAAPRSFSLEQIMSAPFPSGLVAAPVAGKLAWVFNDQGERNIWIAAPPDYAGRAVTSYRGDDGQELGGLAWTPDATAIVYVRGFLSAYASTIGLDPARVVSSYLPRVESARAGHGGGGFRARR